MLYGILPYLFPCFNNNRRGMMDNKQAVKKLFGLLTEHKKTIAVIMICMFFSAGLNLCVPLISRRIMDDGFIGRDKELLIRLVLLWMGVYGLNSLIDIMKEKKRVDIAAKIQYSLSDQAFCHLMKLRISYFNNVNYAEILNNINMDINKMTAIADNTVFFVVTQVFCITGGVAGLFLIDYRMTILVLIFIPIKCIVMKYFAKKQKSVMDEFIVRNQNYAGWFGDTVGGVKEVRLFQLLGKKHQEFAGIQSSIIEKQKQMNMLSQWNLITDSVMVQLLSACLYIAGAELVFDMQLSVGSIFAFVTYSTYVTGPISTILNIGYLLSGIIPSTKRYFEFMDLQEEQDAEGDPQMAAGDLELREVSFAYETGKPVLTGVSILFAQGSKTALIGKNGSGKTTVIQLLARLYEPTGGRILMNGKDISEMPLQSYRQLVSVVSQQIYLFHASIRDNICLYRQIDDHELIAICDDCGLRDFLNEMSLDYVVGENGSRLSGGQKQKVALARALVCDRPIIILDEATSNTDTYSDRQINKLLHTRLRDKTVIMITHKKEILDEVDQIVVLKAGKAASIEHKR